MLTVLSSDVIMSKVSTLSAITGHLHAVICSPDDCTLSANLLNNENMIRPI